MIAVVEVGLCFQRPPTVQKVRRVIVAGETETECQLTAIHLALVPERFHAEPVMPVSSKIVELLAY